jgi:hypothetical protein
MKLDFKTILAMIQRKGVTLLAGILIGLVWCAEDPAIRDLVSRAVVVFGGAGGSAVLVSILMSLANERAAKEREEVALNTMPPNVVAQDKP